MSITSDRYPTPNVTVFADERKRITNATGCTWSYIALLIVPSERVKEALAVVRAHRERIGYFGEVKFAKLNDRSRQKKDFAVALAEELVQDGRVRRDLFSFSMLGLHHNRMKVHYFGDTRDSRSSFTAMYNRFFRTAIVAGLKYAFGAECGGVTIDSVYHDSEGALEEDKYFSWHLPHLLKRDAFFNVRCRTITFVHSDPEKEAASGGNQHLSHLIQMTDVLVGSISHCLDYTSPNRGKDAVAKAVRPLIYRMMQAPANRNSSYRYCGRYTIGFFPNSEGRIYRRRRVLSILPELPFVHSPGN